MRIAIYSPSVLHQNKKYMRMHKQLKFINLYMCKLYSYIVAQRQSRKFHNNELTINVLGFWLFLFHFKRNKMKK